MRIIGYLLGIAIAMGPASSGEPRSLADLHATVVLVQGTRPEGRALAAGVPLTSGSWGTDYLTISHLLSVAGRYAVSDDGKTFADATPVAACSARHHGIDTLILRARAHTHRPALDWGDASRLKGGDELFILPRREFYPEPVRIRFVHLTLLQWDRAKAEELGRDWHQLMVAEGLTGAGFSGSPWVKEGKTYGLLRAQIPRSDRPMREWYTLAESSTRLQECLRILHYEDLVPRG